MGFSFSGQPSYLYHTPSGYIFRLRVPCDLKDLVGQTEFRYSLRTGKLRLAKIRARSIASYIQTLFMKARSNMQEFNKDQIASLVKKYIRETLDNDEMCRALSGKSIGAETLEGRTFAEASNMKAPEAQSMLKVVSRWIQNGDHSFMEGVARKMIQEYGVNVDTESASYKVLERELLKGFHDVLKVRIKRSEGDYSESNEELIPVLQQPGEVDSSQPVESPVLEEHQAVLFSEIKEKYVSENAQSGAWKATTEADYVNAFDLFQRVMGDLDVSGINRRVMAEFKDKLVKLPPNINKSPQYRELSIDEIIASRPKKTLATLSINKTLTRLGSLFRWAVYHGYIQQNSAEGLKVKQNKQANQQREAFTLNDLEKIFGSPEYIQGKHNQPYKYWVPLIALYTGCRLEEICQLHLEDICKEEDIWVFDINNKDGRQLKNQASRRLIPIHPHLMELGLLGDVEQLKKSGALRLFPELRNTHRGKYGHYVGRWFSSYLTKYGVKSETKVFHSFRHTFITHLKHKQVDTYMLQEIDGHSLSGETMGRYGKRYTPDILLKEVIEKVDFGLDLESIKP